MGTVTTGTITSGKKAWEKRIGQVGMACFWAGLLLELLIVVVELSAWTNPFEGQLFRLTFLLFAVKMACSRFTVREWLWLLFFGVLAGICYLCSDRDEAVRLVVFCAAFRGVDVKKALKLAFSVTLAGCLMLALLAVFGIFGNMYIIDDGDRGLRYCFGLGHPNACYCMFWALATLGIYLWHEKMKLWHYGLIALAGILLFLPTRSRTGMIFLFFTLALSLLLAYGKKAREGKLLYVLGIAAFLICVLLSVWIAYYEPYQGPFYTHIDRFITGRITSMNTLEGGGGMLRNWRLFSRPENVKYFDLGYVRLFYWYGILPGAVYVIMYALLMWECRRRKDPLGFMMLLSFALYTMLEAHFVSVYMGRNYALFLMGAYWGGIVGKREDRQKGDEGERKEYFWQVPRLIFHFFNSALKSCRRGERGKDLCV
ncbi:MAG TPA: hypothetical protein H9717_07200 [Candidatus Eisenbergiella merdipullorum]|uniref:Uncharacterized protein n=1 Tax=Candidatus Eisenbergiella merdipullorum TaxID=2838553 RepID=A0A9D2I6S0_9FIRM|nr:hypothetical protein [Candidatus Eisenbergiella merdipullorum]